MFLCPARIGCMCRRMYRGAVTSRLPNPFVTTPHTTTSRCPYRTPHTCFTNSGWGWRGWGSWSFGGFMFSVDFNVFRLYIGRDREIYIMLSLCYQCIKSISTFKGRSLVSSVYKLYRIHIHIHGKIYRGLQWKHIQKRKVLYYWAGGVGLDFCFCW